MAASPAGGPGAPGPSYSAPPGPQPGRSGHASSPAFAFDLKRLSRAELTTGIASLVLMISLFLPWFSVNVGGFGSATGSGMDAHGYLWVTFILSLGVLVLLVARAGWGELPVTLPLTADQILLGATALNLVLVLLGFLIKPGGGVSVASVSVGWSWGAFVALIAAIAAIAPIVTPAIQARRAG